MRANRKYFWMLPLVMAAGLAACDDDPAVVLPDPVNEAEVLVEYMEANADYNTHGGFVIKATDVRTNILTNANQYVIDMRAAEHFSAGHIEGATNVAWGDLVNHLESINADSYDVIVLACYSGQTAAYAAGILRAAGYGNVKSMKWGMSSWGEPTSSPWMNGRSNSRAAQFVTGPSPAMNAEGELPELNTGFETGPEILASRVATVLSEGFGAAKKTNADIFDNLDDYYIINYWPTALYETTGHIPGAIQYDPATRPFDLDSFLKTLPTDKPVAIYCYTGQTSAYLSAYLRVLGYDAKTILYGANGMIYDRMVADGVANAFDPGHDIMNYAYKY
jgi:rhodanese-related sulfurtransferase